MNVNIMAQSIKKQEMRYIYNTPFKHQENLHKNNFNNEIRVD